jgi:hypothetical protein
MKKQMALAGVLILLVSAFVMAQDGRRGTARERWNEEVIVTLKGEITEVTKPLATFKCEDKQYTVHLGPVWFWKQNNYDLKKGETELRGEVEKEADGLHFYPYTITQNAVKIELSNDSGIPKWSSRSNMSGMAKAGRHHGHQACCGGGACQ